MTIVVTLPGKSLDKFVLFFKEFNHQFIIKVLVIGVGSTLCRRTVDNQCSDMLSLTSALDVGEQAETKNGCCADLRSCKLIFLL